MKIISLNQDGIAHWLIPAFFVALIALVGVRVEIASHAASPQTVSSSQEKALSSQIVFSQGNLYTSTNIGPAQSINPSLITPIGIYTGPGSMPDTYASNGSVIYYISSEGKGGDGVYTTNASGQTTRLISSLIPVPANGVFSSLAWSESAQKLAVEVTAAGAYSPSMIYTINPDGSNPTKVYSGDGLGAVVWSPNGSKLAVYDSRDQTGANVYVVNADGSNLTSVNGSYCNDTLYTYGLSWSSNSKYLYCASPGKITRVTMNGTAQDPQLVVTPPLNTAISSGVVSPDGTKILYTAEPDGYGAPLSCTVYVMTLGNGSVKTISQTPSAICEGVDWSPNSNYITFDTAPTGANDTHKVLVARPDGSSLETIYSSSDTGAGSIYGLEWSNQ